MLFCLIASVGILAVVLMTSLVIVYKLTKQSFFSSSALQTELLALKALKTPQSELSSAGVQLGHAILNHKEMLKNTTLPVKKTAENNPLRDLAIPQGGIRVTQGNPD